MPIEPIISRQNRDGGWPHAAGASWTEPTVFAMLAALAANRPDVAGRGAAWLRRVQRPDGGLPPHEAVDESTWVTALAALLPPALLGRDAHARAVVWLHRTTGQETTLICRLRGLLLGNTGAIRENIHGWPWFPGTAAWVGPTVFGTLALRRELRRQPQQPEIAARLDLGIRFLLSHQCEDGGWNHGAPRALGFDAQSYPETTGMALVGLTGVRCPELASGLEAGERLLYSCRSSDGQNWLRLGLMAHGRLPAGFSPRPLPPRNVRDLAIALITEAAAGGNNVLL